MAWIDVIFGTLIGTIAALLLYRLYMTRPIITMMIVFLCVLLGLTFSDHLFTTHAKPWNIFSKIYSHFTPPAPTVPQ